MNRKKVAHLLPNPSIMVNEFTKVTANKGSFKV